MEFYSNLSRYYDLIFPPSREQQAWALGFADPAAPLLDAGCATGELALRLSAAGLKTFGFDADEGMIALARRKAEKSEHAPEFRVDTLQNCSVTYRTGYFGTLLCLGNTLVHLSDLSELTPVLQGFASLLKPGGKLAIQLLNYDRILAGRPAELPPLEAAEGNTAIRFERRYRYEGGKVIFEGILTVDDGADTRSSGAETVLLPIPGDALLEAAGKAGFAAAHLAGDYQGTAADDSSFYYLLTANRPA